MSKLVDSATARPGMIKMGSNCARRGASRKLAFPATRLLRASCPVMYNVEPGDEGAFGGRTRGVRCAFAPMSGNLPDIGANAQSLEGFSRTGSVGIALSELVATNSGEVVSFAERKTINGLRYPIPRFDSQSEDEVVHQRGIGEHGIARLCNIFDLVCVHVFIFMRKLTNRSDLLVGIVENVIRKIAADQQVHQPAPRN